MNTRRSFLKALPLLAAFPTSALARNTRQEYVSLNVNGQWITQELSPELLSTAVLNQRTGLRELTLEIDLPSFPTAYRTSGEMLGEIIQPQLVAECIVAVLVLIVGGIIIYYLLKVCKKKLPTKPDQKRK